MDWSIFALLQMFVITIGVSLAFWLRLRGVRRQNDELRQHFTALEEAPEAPQPSSPEEWIQEKITDLDKEDAITPIVQAVLNNLVSESDTFEATLTTTIQDSNLVPQGSAEDTDDKSQRILELESALEAATDAAPEDTEKERNEELKSLLQQFTKDSREMMGCIQTLESENADLRKQLGLEDQPAPAEDAA